MKTQTTKSNIRTILTTKHLLITAKKLILHKLFLGSIIIFFGGLFQGESSAQSPVMDKLGEAYFFHVNDYPKNQATYWGDGDALTNGDRKSVV